MTSPFKFLRSMSGPLRSFSSSSTSTTSTDQDDSTNRSSSRGSAAISKGGGGSSNSRASADHRKRNQKETTTTTTPSTLTTPPPSPPATAAGRDVKSAILNRVASLRPLPPRSQTWAGRRLSAFFPAAGSARAGPEPAAAPAASPQTPVHDPAKSSQERETPQPYPEGRGPVAGSETRRHSRLLRKPGPSLTASKSAIHLPSTGKEQPQQQKAGRSHALAPVRPGTSGAIVTTTPACANPEELPSRPRYNSISGGGGSGSGDSAGSDPYLFGPELIDQLLTTVASVPPVHPVPPVPQLRLPAGPLHLPALHLPHISTHKFAVSISSHSGLVIPPPQSSPPVLAPAVAGTPDLDRLSRHSRTISLFPSSSLPTGSPPAGSPHSVLDSSAPPSMPFRMESRPMSRPRSRHGSPQPLSPHRAPSPPSSPPPLPSREPVMGDHAVAPFTHRKGRSVSAQIPLPHSSLPRGSSPTGPRFVSNPFDAVRPATSGSPSLSPVGSSGPDKDTRRSRRSWFPTRSRSNSRETSQPEGQAWILDTKEPYSPTALINGDRVDELWSETGDVYIHLFPKDASLGPSFKIPHMVIASSNVLNHMISAEHTSAAASSRHRTYGGRDQLSVNDATISRTPSPPTLPHESHLYIADPPEQRPDRLDPIPDIERLVGLRNLFAFLMGQPLVATRKAPAVLDIFLGIAAALEEFAFVGSDGGFGEVVAMVFSAYADRAGLADLRESCDKVLQGLVLGERMRCADLYDGAFTHAVGRYDEIVALRSSSPLLFDQVSILTRQKIEKAHLALAKRVQAAAARLDQFDYPSIFAGVASSTSNEELRGVRFKTWRTAFGRIRSFMTSHYKGRYGAWPPRSSGGSRGGLNRLVVGQLYADLCALYDLLVDRRDLTPRELHGLPENIPMAGDGMITGLRRLLSEYENSITPIPPPIPYDVPLVPTMAAIHEPYDDLPAKERARFDRRVKDYELSLVLNKAYNYDTAALDNEFLTDFKEFEHREARAAKSQPEMANQRIGYWIFMYVVLQSLPLLVIDAPGLRHTDGVEGFLCEAPWGNAPWATDQMGPRRKMWYEVNNGAGLVELPADYIMLSTEAIYHRSHCWQAARRWEVAAGSLLLSPGHRAAPGPHSAMFKHDGTEGDDRDRDRDGGSSDGGSGDYCYSPGSHGGGAAHLAPPSQAPFLPPAPPASLRARSSSPSPFPAGAAGRNSYRSSIVMGFEPLSAPDSLDILSSGRRASGSAFGGGPAAWRPAPRVASVGNLAALTQQHQHQHQQHPLHNQMATAPGSDHVDAEEASGQTFDDILGEQPKMKKKSWLF